MFVCFGFQLVIIMNLGKLQIWSNGMYDSTLHRVINTSPKYRVCVAYFYEVSPTYPFYALSSLAPGNDPHTAFVA